MRTCLIVLGTLLAASRAAAGDAPTFYKDVLPILQANCQRCHRPGEVAPMSLLTFEETRPWARAIKTAVASRQMPPWFADPNVGHFANERRLSREALDTIATWVDAGAPAGDANDAPPPVVFENGWNIKPDVIVEMPKPFELPARGTINYKYVLVKANFKEDMWVTAAEMRPGNSKVLHHGKVWVRPPGSEWMATAVPGEAYERETQRADHRRERHRARQRHPREVQSRTRRAALRHRRRREIHPERLRPRVRTALHDDRRGDRGRVKAWPRAREGTAADALLLPRGTNRHEPRDPGRRPERGGRQRNHVRRDGEAGVRAAAHASARARISSCASCCRPRRR